MVLPPRRFLPSLSLLAAFEAASRTGSVTAAARELGLTQGAVSRQILALEEQLGVALFLRERDDTEVSASVGVRWQPQANWLITPQISYRRNDSNIPLNEYDRLDAGVRAKWQF